MAPHSSTLAWKIPWTATYQAPPSMGFSRQEYWSGLPFPSTGDLPNPGIKSVSSAFQSDALTSEPPGKPIINKREINILSQGLNKSYLFPEKSIWIGKRMKTWPDV